jgi:hypothetical protein
MVCYGITFQCPHCKTQRLGVLFTPPIDANGGLEKNVCWFHGLPKEGPFWKRTGDTFEDITLCPSINANSRIDVPGHWHGFIENGEVK